MSLLGTPLLVVLACATVLFPLGTFVLWSRVRGPKVARFGERFGMLLAGQLATVLLVGALANDANDFYTSWGDLIGSPGGHAAIRNYGAGVTGSPGGRGTSSRSASAAGHPKTTPGELLKVLTNTGWSTPAQFASKGKVEQVLIAGQSSGLSEDGYVYLPPEYFQHKYATRRFPAVETLSGYPGSSLAQFTKLGYPGISARLVREHTAKPMIFVMLASNPVLPRDTECTNVVNGPQVETYFARDVPTAMQSVLRVAHGRWGIIGDSTGGYCATKILMRYYHTFKAAVSLSGYYFARADSTTGNLWGGSKAVEHANDPEWLLAHRPAPPVSLLATSSRQETRFDELPDLKKFLRLVKPPMHVTTLIESRGGHNNSTWIRELPTALRWLSARLTATAGATTTPALPHPRKAQHARSP